MSESVLHAQNLTEARLFLLVTPCGVCGKGPCELESASLFTHEPAEGSATLVDVACRCRECRTRATQRFQVEDFSQPAELTALPGSPLRDVSEPSRLIDLPSWLTLCQMLAVQADLTSNRVDSRRLRIAAGLCLEESLKFFTDEENDLPPADAFFSDASRERFRADPRVYSRQHLLGLRAKFPTPPSRGRDGAST